MGGGCPDSGDQVPVTAKKFYAFWNSPEYEEAKKIRKGKAILNNVILDEMPG